MQRSAAQALERQLRPLAPLLDELVLVGGAAVPLWVSAPGAPPARPTNDTDLIVATRSLVRYHRLGARLRELGFAEASDSRVLCRWRHTATDGTYDVMPLDASILGFSNRWYDGAHENAVSVALPGGTLARAATPAYLVATKLVAFDDRGQGDHLASHDIYDVIALLDGRPNLLDEIRAAPSDLRAWLTDRFKRMVDSPRAADDAILNYLPHDAPDLAHERLLEAIHEAANT
jgi:hypothetical protein